MIIEIIKTKILIVIIVIIIDNLMIKIIITFKSLILIN